MAALLNTSLTLDMLLRKRWQSNALQAKGSYTSNLDLLPFLSRNLMMTIFNILNMQINKCDTTVFVMLQFFSCWINFIFLYTLVEASPEQVNSGGVQQLLLPCPWPCWRQLNNKGEWASLQSCALHPICMSAAHCLQGHCPIPKTLLLVTAKLHLSC